MLDLTKVKLGKKDKVTDKRTVMFKDYLDKELPAIIPTHYGWDTGITDWGMDLNDTLGDCAIAGPAHQIKSWNFNSTKTTVDLTDAQILTAYSAVSGYVPGDSSTDNGCNLLDVLKYWKNTGIGGHKIDGFVEIEPTNTNHCKLGLQIFGGLDIGIQMPIAWQTATVWDVPADGDYSGDYAPGSWGGHCVLPQHFDNIGVRVVTWGMEIVITWAAWAQYVDEVYAELSNDFLNNNQTPSGIHLANLQKDISLLS